MSSLGNLLVHVMGMLIGVSDYMLMSIAKP